MPVTYNKLFHLLIELDIKKGELQRSAGITASIMARLGRNETVRTDTIGKICKALECQPGDIMEYVPEKENDKALDSIVDEMYNRYDIYHDLITKDEMKNLVKQSLNINKTVLNQDKLIRKLKNLYDRKLNEQRNITR